MQPSEPCVVFACTARCEGCDNTWSIVVLTGVGAVLCTRVRVTAAADQGYSAADAQRQRLGNNSTRADNPDGQKGES